MSFYLFIKGLHILSSVIMVGTGFGSALYVFFANRIGSLEAKYYVNRMVVFLDWCFTTPTVIIQPLTGIWLINYIGWKWSSPWLLNVYLCYAIVGCAWLPVVWLQIRMRDLTNEAVEEGKPLDPRYNTYRKWWEFLGYIGFGGALGLFYLMVTKKPIIAITLGF